MTARSWLLVALMTPVTGCSLLVDTDPFQTHRDGGTSQDGGPITDGEVPDPDAPTAPVVRITPDAPVTTDDLTMEIVTESVDPLAAGAVTYRIEWLRDGAEVPFSEATVPPAETAKGQTWTVRVIPTSADGARTGAAGTAEVTIGNLPPALGYVGLGDYRPIRGETLEALTGPVTDPDGDVTRYVYTWLLDGAPIDGETGPRLVLDSVAAGARVKVRVTPRDSDDLEGEAIETGEAVVVEDTIRWRQLAPDRFYDDGGRIVYDPPNRRVLVFYHPSDAEPVDMRVWEYALEPLGARWIELHPTGDAIRLFGTMPPILDEVNRRLLFLGGYEGETLTNRLVAFDLSVRGAERWEELTPSGDLPTLRQFNAMAYDAERQQVLLYGGVVEGAFEPINELLALDVSRPGFETWTRTALPGAGVAGPTMVIDPERDRALFLGGLGAGAGGTPVLLDTIYTLDLTAPDEGLSLTTARLPAGLIYSTVVVDLERDRALIAWGLESFAGPAASFRALDLETFAATDVAPAGSAPTPGVLGFMGFDPYDGSRLIVHPGPPAADGGDSTPRFDLYRMDAATAQFTPFVRYGVDEPPGLAGASGAKDESGLLLFGGETGTFDRSDEVWRLNRRTGWTQLTMMPDTVTGRTPEPRHGAGAALSFDGLRIFGGDDNASLAPATAWTLHPLFGTDAEWVEHTVVAASPVPDPREGASVFDPHCASGQLGVFGGRGNPFYRDETWTLSCPAGELRGCTWEQVSFAASPQARAYSAMEETMNEIVLYGGRSDAGTFDDVWLLAPCADPPVWTAVPVTGTPPARWSHTMTRRGDDTLAGVSRWVIFGGFSTNFHESSASNQAWMLVDESGAYRWELLSVASGPNDAVIDARGAHVAAWSDDSLVPRLLVYGGRSRNDVRSDLWELRFPPATP